ncbi:prohead protease/major capsid protein fusion protein [Jeongeupia naejangsanensis]|uniref:Mu-like prophage major head subunit gpT family protein n=1 Tax=Jeongeupia naejangsanensis TaxID=613195 RepID=A0ABS2BF93_9NEIS|nr:prohead protease/major capsid protein fusion protein [Jeongeupia naejangsanensis]MBM3114273.1 Mu-like prophage major head subunit gpT family protein [Jeongeupia naejangsanensis]
MSKPDRTQDPDGPLIRGGLPLQSRAYAVTSVNEAARTVELVWTTGAAVRRFDWQRWRYFIEELEVSDAAIRLERLNGGAGLLDNHNSGELSDQIGVVERAWLEGGLGHAEVRFSRRAEVEPVWQDVVDGVIRNVSVGYVVHGYEITETEGQTPVYRAIDWEPYELSMVPIPADPGAVTRSAVPADLPDFPIHYRYTHAAQEEPPMDQAQPAIQPEQTERQQAIDPPAAPAQQRSQPAATPAAADSADAVATERQRGIEIRTLVRKSGLDEALADELIGNGTPLARAHEAIFQRLFDDDQVAPTRSGIVQTVRDETDVRRTAMTEAMLHRAQPGQYPLTDAARNFRGMSLVDLGRECVERAGGRTRGLVPAEIADLALNNTRGAGMASTSDYPIILGNVISRVLQSGYALAGQTFWPLVRERTAADFRELVGVSVGQDLSFKPLDEHGEYQEGKLLESEQRYRLQTYGRKISVTRQLIINDDLGVFTNLAARFGRSAANLESDLVWSLIISNLLMADGKSLFCADHANDAETGAAISVDAIGELDTLIGLQTDMSGDALNLGSKYLIVPRSLKLAASKAIAVISPNKAEDTNPFQNDLQIIAEPRLDRADKAAWYLATDPAQCPIVELAYLEGQRGVYTATREGFDVDGIEVKARLDIGVGLQDFRGIARNKGQ